MPPEPLEIRLDFYSSSIVMHSFDNGVIQTRMVSAEDIVTALVSNMTLHSGILPPDTLWWSSGRGLGKVGLWRPPKVWKVAVELKAFEPPERMELPMPGLIFVCEAGRPPAVYAAKRRPTSLEEEVFHAPLLNLYPNGMSCQGTHRYSGDIAAIPEEFFTSFFTATGIGGCRSNSHPDSVYALWKELDGKRRFPTRELVPLGVLGDVVGGGQRNQEAW